MIDSVPSHLLENCGHSKNPNAIMISVDPIFKSINSNLKTGVNSVANL